MKTLLLFALMLTCFFSGFCQKIDKYNGFLKNIDGTYFFYEITGDTLLPSRIAVFTEDTLGLGEITTIKRISRFGDDVKHITLWGYKIDSLIAHQGNEFNVIKIRNVEPYLLFDFSFDKSHTVIDNEEYIETEGYFTRVFEGISYTAIENNTKIWTGSATFSKELENVDSLTYILHRWNSRGMYLKVQGVKKYGSHHGYGHFGGFDSKITITKIIAADTTRTYKGFLRDKLLTEGYVVYGKDTVRPVADLEPGKEYRFSAKDDAYIYKLRVKKVNPADIEYTLEYYKRKKLKKTVSGIATLNTFTARQHMLYNSPYIYESLDEYDFNGDAMVEIEVGETDSTTGKSSIYIEDHVSGLWPVDGQLKLTEE